ncbi:phosphatidylinositol-4,5-bisphosphate 5-phosphatase [Aureococcus anophagefferens]|uniref:Phosphatidylinositol-4,5-bisphosphate 5-phosphatase n=1 Tax=Aureococcus anophagefferens TaxID=44056 RepID=A0ABR1FNS1_AURAN
MDDALRRGAAAAPLAFAPGYEARFGANAVSARMPTPPPSGVVQAWTDRVLFSPDGLAPYEYDAVPAAAHSDHRPVFAKFAIMIE